MGSVPNKKVSYQLLHAIWKCSKVLYYKNKYGRKETSEFFLLARIAADLENRRTYQPKTDLISGKELQNNEYEIVQNQRKSASNSVKVLLKIDDGFYFEDIQAKWTAWAEELFVRYDFMIPHSQARVDNKHQFSCSV